MSTQAFATSQMSGVPDGMMMKIHRVKLQKRLVTTAVVEDGEGMTCAVGVAICSPLDEHDNARGDQIAVGRALAELDGRMAIREQKRTKEAKRRERSRAKEAERRAM